MPTKTVGIFRTVAGGPAWGSSAGSVATGNLVLLPPLNGVVLASNQDGGNVGQCGSSSVDPNQADYGSTSWASYGSWTQCDKYMYYRIPSIMTTLIFWSAPFWMLGNPDGTQPVLMPVRSDLGCSITNGSASVVDANCVSGDVGQPCATSTGFAAAASIVSVNPGVGFVMNSAASVTNSNVQCAIGGAPFQDGVNGNPGIAQDFWPNLNSWCVSDSNVTNAANFCAYIVQRYTGNRPASEYSDYNSGTGTSAMQQFYAANPITHLSIWSEMHGYYDKTVTSPSNQNYRWDRYATLFNAIYSAVKTVVPSVLVGGPYASIPLATNQASPILQGDWGQASNPILQGLQAMAGINPMTIVSSTGSHVVPAFTNIDYFATDLGGTLTTMTFSQICDRLHDVCQWYKQNLCSQYNGCPLMVQEVYWIDNNGNPYGTGLPAILNAGYRGGADWIQIFHAHLGVAALFVDGNGNPTDAYPYLQSYQYNSGFRFAYINGRRRRLPYV